MRHTKKQHGNCPEPHCNICNLFTCAVCTASEGELPKDCPGRTMTEAEKDAVMNRRMDFVDGDWTALKEKQRG